MLFLDLTKKFFKQYKSILGVQPKLAIEHKDWPFEKIIPEVPSDYWQLIKDYNISVDFNVVAEIMKIKAARIEENITQDDALALFEESRRKHWFVDYCEKVEVPFTLAVEYHEFIGGFLKKDASEIDPDLYSEVYSDLLQEWRDKYTKIRTQNYKKLIRGIKNLPISDGTDKDPEPNIIRGIDRTGTKDKKKKKFIEDSLIEANSKGWFEKADKDRGGTNFHKEEHNIKEVPISDETNFIGLVERFFNQFYSSIGIREFITVSFLGNESPLLPVDRDKHNAVISASRCVHPFNIAAEILKIKMSMKKDDILIGDALDVIESTRKIKWCSKLGNEDVDLHPLMMNDLKNWMESIRPIDGDIFAGMGNDLQDDLIKERKEIYNQLIRGIKGDKKNSPNETKIKSTKLSVLKPKMSKAEEDSWRFGEKKDIEEEIEESTPTEKESTNDFIFENNFDHVDPEKVYDYFHEKLVGKKEYLTEDVFRKYLIAAFQDSNITKDRKEKDPIKKPFRFNGKISKTYIYETYRYYQIEIAGQETGTQARIAKLVGHYFSDFKSKTVYGNMNNYE